MFVAIECQACYSRVDVCGVPSPMNRVDEAIVTSTILVRGRSSSGSLALNGCELRARCAEIDAGCLTERPEGGSRSVEAGGATRNDAATIWKVTASALPQP